MEAKKRIKEYLDNRASEDALFAQSYSKPNKNFDECYDYILSEAKKRGSRVCMTDDEVFGLAVHYYDEDKLEVKKFTGSASVSTGAIASKKVELTEEEKEKAKEEAVKEFKETYIQRLQAEEKEKARKLAEKKIAKQTEVQPSLFDF
jgi:hypothetical protein